MDRHAAIIDELSPGLMNDQARVADYLALLKPKVMSLVVFSGLAGMVMAPGFTDVHPVLLLGAILSLAIGAGAAGAINMWYDRDIDALMTRTRHRPIPAGCIPAEEALNFGMVMALFSVMTMTLVAGVLAASLLAFSIFFYVVVYTIYLKRRTPQNIVIGGAAGAFPPLIGWAAVTGQVDLLPLCLFALIFFWTPPHFWALSLFIKDEYARAGVPMMPVVRGENATKRLMFLYTLILLPLSLMPVFLGAVGMIYAVVATIFSSVFIMSAWRVWQTNDLRPARAMFGFSVLYLFILFLTLMIDKI